ncbi:MAG: PRC-barrel domain-containing protein [Pseudomonadota bacterium]
MIKTLMISTALTGLLIGGAVAQTAPDTQPMQPQAMQPADTGTKDAERAPTSSGANATAVTIINNQTSDQWLSSNFIGVDVVGPDNEKIGDITDILFEKNGNVVGYVVGVGGFLGIGAKNVALAPTSFQVVPANADRATTGAASGTVRADDVKLKLNMTKDQLKQAASFEPAREQEAKSRAAAQPAPGGGMNRPSPK